MTGFQLRDTMRDLGLNTTELASLWGCSRQTVSAQINSGQVKPIYVYAMRGVIAERALEQLRSTEG